MPQYFCRSDRQRVMGKVRNSIWEGATFRFGTGSSFITCRRTFRGVQRLLHGPWRQKNKGALLTGDILTVVARPQVM